LSSFLWITLHSQ